MTIESRPGFQGSETSGAEVIFYPQDQDPVVVNSKPVLFEGRSERDQSPSLLSATTAKVMGQGAGTWSISLKPGRDKLGEGFFNRLVDDDWVDISFKRHGRKWHTMRGLVDSIQRVRTIGGSGATSTTFHLTGSDFASIWERTPIWFNPFAGENLAGGMSAQVWNSAARLQGSPVNALTGYLRGFLEALATKGRATWEIPKGMPNSELRRFITSVKINSEGYDATQTLQGLNPNFLMPNGTAWALAKEWSDPMFNELFADSLPDRYFNTDGGNWAGGMDPKETFMTVMFRRRPFPRVDLGLSSPYFSLPIHRVSRRTIENDDVTRSGAERFNAFFVAPQMTQELTKGSAIDILQPEWSESDILKHGLRRFDVSTKYIDFGGDLLGTAAAHRILARDWYMINPYLLSGTVSLAVGRPDIRIGTRVRVPGDRSELEDETYYVESVNNSWSFGSSQRTSLGVTRGWIGTDASYMEALNKLAALYSNGTRAVPEGTD